jgi:hypothetical protein
VRVDDLFVDDLFKATAARMRALRPAVAADVMKAA